MILRILYIEDDEVDRLALRRALTRANVEHELTIVSDGEAGLAMLRKIEAPFIVLLDIGLPRASGIEVLARIRIDPDLCDLPVWFLTTSDDPRDLEAADKLGADGYFLKGDAADKPEDFIDALLLIWEAVSSKRQP